MSRATITRARSVASRRGGAARERRSEVRIGDRIADACGGERARTRERRAGGGTVVALGGDPGEAGVGGGAVGDDFRRAGSTGATTTRRRRSRAIDSRRRASTSLRSGRTRARARTTSPRRARSARAARRHDILRRPAVRPSATTPGPSLPPLRCRRGAPPRAVLDRAARARGRFARGCRSRLARARRRRPARTARLRRYGRRGLRRSGRAGRRSQLSSGNVAAMCAAPSRSPLWIAAAACADAPPVIGRSNEGACRCSSAGNDPGVARSPYAADDATCTAPRIATIPTSAKRTSGRATSDPTTRTPRDLAISRSSSAKGRIGPLGPNASVRALCANTLEPDREVEVFAILVEVVRRQNVVGVFLIAEEGGDRAASSSEYCRWPRPCRRPCAARCSGRRSSRTNRDTSASCRAHPTRRRASLGRIAPAARVV